jgi:AmmeMemoRadiSam system protein A
MRAADDDAASSRGGRLLPALLAQHADAAAAAELADLGPADQRRLLDIARVALAVASGQRPPAALASALSDARRQRVGRLSAAAFVTLFSGGGLRGCMGEPDARRPLAQAVANACLLAALDDPRFWPVRAAELAHIYIEVSVLGPFREAAHPEAIKVGRDGVCVERDGRRALLLPQVATELGWDARRLWAEVCRKADLAADAWRDPRTRRQVFQALRFGGPAAAAQPPASALGGRDERVEAHDGDGQLDAQREREDGH